MAGLMMGDQRQADPSNHADGGLQWGPRIRQKGDESFELSQKKKEEKKEIPKNPGETISKRFSKQR